MSRWLALSAFVIVLDQLSKGWITNHFIFGESLTVLSVFDLVLAHNTGAAFSFLSDAGGMQRWLFGIIAIGASVGASAYLGSVIAGKFGFEIVFILLATLGYLHFNIIGYVVAKINRAYRYLFTINVRLTSEEILPARSFIWIDTVCPPLPRLSKQ